MHTTDIPVTPLQKKTSRKFVTNTTYTRNKDTHGHWLYTNNTQKVRLPHPATHFFTQIIQKTQKIELYNSASITSIL